MVKVRTTMQPGQEIEVDDREAYALRNQGLLVDGDVEPTPAPGMPDTVVDAETGEAPKEETKDDDGSSSSRSGKRSGSSK